MRGDLAASIIYENDVLSLVPLWSAKEFVGPVNVLFKGVEFWLPEGVTASAAETPENSPKWEPKRVSGVPPYFSISPRQWPAGFSFSNSGGIWLTLNPTANPPETGDWLKLSDAAGLVFLGPVGGKYTHVFVDANKQVVAGILKDSGDIVTPDAPGGLGAGLKELGLFIESLQKLIYSSPSGADNLFAVTDKNKDVVMRLAKVDGGLHVPGLDQSVQEEIEALKSGGAKSYPPNSLISTEPKTNSAGFADILDRRLRNGLTNFAVPHGQTPQDWTWDMEDIKTLTAPLSPTYVPIGMMNGANFNPNSGVVHPNVVEFDFPVNGYKFWMTINGYPNEAWEITWLYGSNDPEFKEWTLIADVPQPFEDNPPIVPPYISSHDSDSFMAYNPLRGEMIVAWRRTMRWHPSAANGQTNEYRFRTSTNGVNWSEIKQMVAPITADIELLQSASIVFNPADNLFYMFDCHPGQLKVRTAPDIYDGMVWSDPVNIPTPAYFNPWHLEVKYVGDIAVMLVHENQNLPLKNDKLWFGASKDLLTWTWQETDLFGGNSPMYKASFVPVLYDDGFSFRVAYTTDENAELIDDDWRLRITETNKILF